DLPRLFIRDLGSPGHGIAHPLFDSGLAPSGAALGNAHLSGKGAVLDLAIERRTRKSGPVEHGIEAHDAVLRRCDHGLLLRRITSEERQWTWAADGQEAGLCPGTWRDN